MSEAESQGDRNWKLLIAAAVIAGVLVVGGLISTILDLFAPVPSVHAEGEPGPKDPTLQRRARVAKHYAEWNPARYAGARYAHSDKKVLTREDLEELKYTMGGDVAQIRAQQMKYLRTEAATPSSDDREARPTETDIAQMEQKGVILW